MKDSVQCPVCDALCFHKYGDTPYWICPICDVWHQSPLPPKSFECTGETDETGSSTGHQMSPEDKLANAQLAQVLFAECLKGVPGVTLDIGSKYPFLAHCLKNLGCDAYGMDNLSRVPDYSQSLEVPMHMADFEGIVDTHAWVKENLKEKPKLITMVHVFEHMYEPLQALRRLREIIADDGLLFLRMPDHNVPGFERDLTANHYQIHPFFHTMESVLELLSQAGDLFKVVRTYCENGLGQRDYILKPITRRPRITAGFIAKNEERDLPRVLRSLKGVVESVVLVDTGSTDRTLLVADEVTEEIGVSLHAEVFTDASSKDEKGDWKLWNFGEARNRYVDLIAKTDADYVLWMDSDDELMTPNALRRAVYLDMMQVFTVKVHQGDMHWPQHRMWKNGLGIRYEGACHEYPTIGGFLCHESKAVVQHDAAPGLGEDSNQRNLRILQREFEKNPTPRVAFYLGNTHKDAGRFHEAIDPYASRIAMGPHFRDEWLFAHLYKGRCERAAGKHAEATRTLLAGTSNAPEWSEFWMELAYMALDHKKFYSCIGFSSLALRGNIPPTSLWREPNKYTDQPARMLSFAYEGLGDTASALQWAEEASHLIGCPDEDWTERIQKLKNDLGDEDTIALTETWPTSERDVVVAILAKDKAHTLPTYLECLEKQTFPKSRIHLYVRTNNNTDETTRILADWVAKHGADYASVFFDMSDVKERVERFGQHEWNSERFKVLGAIRQASLEYAIRKDAHYFVVDCDNFIATDTLSSLYGAYRQIASPLLRSDHGNGYYSNYHSSIDENGYYKNDDIYRKILFREPGYDKLVEVPVVHCTYFVQHEVLDKLSYDDGSGRYEYVIFSDSARKAGVKQFIDARSIYGFITMAETTEEMPDPKIVQSATLGTRTDANGEMRA